MFRGWITILTLTLTLTTLSGSGGPSQGLLLRAGTYLKVRVNAPVSSNHQADQRFPATLDEPLYIGDVLVARRGARVEGVVRGWKVEPKGTCHVELAVASMETGRRIQVAVTTTAATMPAPGLALPAHTRFLVQLTQDLAVTAVPQ